MKENTLTIAEDNCSLKKEICIITKNEGGVYTCNCSAGIDWLL